jgi:release factor glutamine methyltransferase
VDAKTDQRKSQTDEPWTYGRLLDWTARFLADKGVEFPRLDTEVLLSHTLGCKRIDLYTRYDEPATEEERAHFKDLIRKRLEGCPVAYLVGHKEFFSLEFEVGPAVLIPRPDTETLVVEALRLAKDMTDPQILDIGTGSGAIPVAIAKRHATARLTATDISADALAVAQRNAARHGVAERIRFLQGDLFAPLSPEERFDFILSNPPYIGHEDMPSLPAGVRDYEPHIALDGGPGGYAVFDRLIEAAPCYLKPGGYLIVEIGSPQEEPARQHLTANPRYALGPTIKDGSGHPRVLRALWRG